MPKVKKKLTAQQKRIRKAAKAERREKFQWIFINGKQVRIKREESLEEYEKQEALIRSADPIWLHQNELWEYMQPEDECLDIELSESDQAIWVWDGDDEKVPFEGGITVAVSAICSVRGPVKLIVQRREFEVLREIGT